MRLKIKADRFFTRINLTLLRDFDVVGSSNLKSLRQKIYRFVTNPEFFGINP